MGWLARAIAWLWSYTTTLYFVVLLVLVFALAVFTGSYLLRFVPQEFGGVRPKCAILDLATNEMSPELTALLLDPSMRASPLGRVMRSRRVAVFSTTGPWLLQVPAPTAEAPALRRSLRLSESAVRSVEWVGRATPAIASDETCPEDP